MFKNKEIESLKAQLAKLTALTESDVVQKALQQVAIEKEKQQAYNELVKSPLKYDIIRDFIEAAKHDVVVRFTVDGIPIEIRKDVPHQQKNKYSSETF
jgi:Zn-dependent M32 family carboxypeptidase